MLPEEAQLPPDRYCRDLHTLQVPLGTFVHLITRRWFYEMFAANSFQLLYIDKEICSVIAKLFRQLLDFRKI